MTHRAVAERCAARVLVAPDSFKGTHTAPDVAALLATGLRAVGADPVACPLADGGEGTLEVLRPTIGGSVHKIEVTGPDGRHVLGQYLLSEDRLTAVVETASASGLTLTDPRHLDPWHATTRGTGDLIAAAAAGGAERILVGVGGSATTDGGLGAIEAILERGGLRGARLEILCDVGTTFELAASVYGPQKGADDVMVARLEQRLNELADRLPRDPRGVPRTGCAGGLSGGLWAQFDAQLRSGIDSVLEAVGFVDTARTVAAVVTGEGRLDAQTAAGKVMAGLVGACRELDVTLPVHAVVGQSLLTQPETRDLGLASVSIASTAEDLVETGRELGRRILAESRDERPPASPAADRPRARS